MGKRGVKPKGKVALAWTPKLAYAIGLIVSDGNLSPSGRHVVFVSKDRQQLNNYMHALGIQVHLKPDAIRVQFGDILFYHFLQSIGLMPNKSKVIGKIEIPPELFFDFLRGSFDGDGCTYSYFDPRWPTSFLFYTTFVSASKKHVDWLREEIFNRLGILGHISTTNKRSLFQLRYAKRDSLKLLRSIYYAPGVICLSRKRLKIQKALRIMGERL